MNLDIQNIENRVGGLLLFLSLFILSACQTIDIEPSYENMLQDQADFNNSLVPGLGNVFYEKNIRPNSLSQLLSIIQYKGDTLALFGKTNESNLIEHVHTTVLTKKNSNQAYVTEFFPKEGVSLSYILDGNKKGRFVLEVRRYSKTIFSISLLDYNWNARTSKAISALVFENDKEIRSFNSARILNEGNGTKDDCSIPWDEIVAEPLEKVVVKLGENFLCRFPVIKKVDDFIKKAKENAEFQANHKDFDDLNEGVKLQKEAIEDVSKVNDIKYVQEPLIELKIKYYPVSDLEKQREEDVKAVENKVAQMDAVTVILDPSSKVDYDVLTGEGALLNLKTQETNASAGDLIFMYFLINDEIVYIEDFDLLDYSKVFLTYQFDPKLLKNFETLSDYKISYGTSLENLVTITGSIFHLNPSFLQGGISTHFGKPGQLLEDRLLVKVLDDKERPLPGINVEWKIKLGSGSLSSEDVTDSDGFAKAQWTLGIEEEQLVEVVVKKRDGSLVNGAPLLFKANLQNLTNCDLAVNIQKDGNNVIAQVTGGTEPYTYYWSNGSTSTSLNNLSPGTYTVVVKDKVGCENSASISITGGPEFGTVTDPRENKVYKTVRIGTQVWFAENLSYSGDIPQIKSDADWYANSDPAWCYYMNNPANEAKYGKLYNWEAVELGSFKTLCPPGWHIPSVYEWDILENFLGNEEGGKMKAATDWQENPTTSKSTNESGFTAMPGGHRKYDGVFSPQTSGYWWGHLPGSYNQWFRRLDKNSPYLFFGVHNGNEASSCRCLKD